MFLSGKGGGTGGAGGHLPPQNSQHEKNVPFFLGQKCPFSSQTKLPFAPSNKQIKIEISKIFFKVVMSCLKGIFCP